MGYRIRQIEPEGELGQAIRVDAITQVVPLEDIQDALQVCDALPEFQLIDPADHPRLWTRLLVLQREFVILMALDGSAGAF